MSQYRECICKNYVAFGVCKQGREARPGGFCQICDKYDPRENVKYIHRCEEYTEKKRVNAR